MRHAGWIGYDGRVLNQPRFYFRQIGFQLGKILSGFVSFVNLFGCVVRPNQFTGLSTESITSRRSFSSNSTR